MCKISENKNDIQTGNGAVGGCGGTCKAFVKNGECPLVLKMLRKAQKEITAKNGANVVAPPVAANLPQNNL